MNNTSKILRRGLVFLAAASAAALAIGCADGTKLAAQQQEIHNQADNIFDRAYRCAPVELAKASANEEFGRMELADGNGRRAEDHITFADEKIKEADAKSLSVYCQDPKTIDKDKDGIPDMEDLCPETPGTAEFKGCPNPDKDGDSVCDPWVAEMGLSSTFTCQGTDLCPDDPGELAYSGCSNPDRDGDGFCDHWVSALGLSNDYKRTCKGDDWCEDLKGSADYEGCPNPDSDMDGVCDPWVAEHNMMGKFQECTGTDKCPYEKGTVEENGCPPPRKFIVVTENAIELKEQFFFATNKTKVLAKSEPLLNEIAEVLKDNPNIHIAIEGHTDSSGKRKANIKLSQGRAKSVMQELIKRGIDKKRMTSAGYGPDKPIDTNDTPEGRANNRRVELRITKR